MALVSSVLAQDMLSATKDASSADIGLKKLGDAIGKYVSDNANVVFNSTIMNGKITGFNPSLQKSNATNQTSGLTKLANDLKTAMLLSVAKMPEGFITTPSPMASAPTLSSLVLNINGDNRDDAFNQFADQICNWIKSCIPTVPSVGGSGVSFIVTSIL